MALHRQVTLEIFDNNVGISDAVLLDPLTEQDFIENLRERFSHDQIYTYIGNVVVSVNPYKPLTLYTHDVISEYRSRNIYELPPHIYAIADGAYRSLRDYNLDQCIIISGESGSGKTEASKLIMQYVAEVSDKGQQIDNVKEQLLQCNPVLEAFGNAKTNKNDNSSRFGKYMDIEFDYKGEPVGGVISNYLLEKSRVAVQSKGERNFHVLYQLLTGADDQLLADLRLTRDIGDYEYLKYTTVCDDIDDSANFTVTTNGMNIIGFTDEETKSIYVLLASILKLGNIGLTARSNQCGTDGCSLQQGSEIDEVCDLLSCDAAVLESALTQKSVETAGEKLYIDLNIADATYARDALCKAIYSRLFTWLVTRINDSIKVKATTRTKVMGVLDIYGFEVFEHNGFEQFIINFCNEKLQQIFIELTLKEEQGEYVSEGIEWIHVDFFDNSVICDLIEKNNVGILSMLDEECLMPGHVSDLTFLTKVNDACGCHPHFESRAKNPGDKTLERDCFRLRHYAGNVTYSVTGFLDKNNDLLFRDLSQAMFSCNLDILKQMFPEGDPQKTSLKRPPTLGSQFKQSVSELMKNLLSKNPNYIRCIKPNDLKEGGKFDDILVTHQVRYLGLMENVRVRRAGYAFRQPYPHFLYRYKMLARETWPVWTSDSRTGVEVILRAQGVQPDQYTFGLTKIFIQQPRTLFELEERRRDTMNYLATVIQAAWRGHVQREIFQMKKRSQIIISCNFRAYRAQKAYQRQRMAAIVIASYARGWKARCILARLKHEKRVLTSVTLIQAFARHISARCLLAQLRYEKLCHDSATVIQKYHRGTVVRRQYRKLFRANAAPKVIRCVQIALKKRFLIGLHNNLPSMSPTNTDWPSCSSLHQHTSDLLRQLYHRWRCAKYRARFDEDERLHMREKVTASDLFRGKKTLYPLSVSGRFMGDYVNLSGNLKWKKRTADNKQDGDVLFAAATSKMNRTNGKMVPHVLAVTRESVLIIDPRSMAVKYRFPVSAIHKMSLSPLLDRVLVLHVHQENGDVLTKKGDLVLVCDHVIEVIAKTYHVINTATGKLPAIDIATKVSVQVNGKPMVLSFATSCLNGSDLKEGDVVVQKKATTYNVMVHEGKLVYITESDPGV